MNKDTSTENQILEAAKSIFQSKGMDGARMQEIADKAGINKAMLHYYYRSKQQLFEAVFKHAFFLLAPQLHNILNDDSGIEEKIRNFTFNYISFIVKHPYLPNFIIQELNRNPNFAENFIHLEGFPKIEKFKLQLNEEIEIERNQEVFLNEIRTGQGSFTTYEVSKPGIFEEKKGFGRS